MHRPSYRVQALLNLRRNGTLTIEQFAARLKEFSVEELADLVKCISNLVSPIHNAHLS